MADEAPPEAPRGRSNASKKGKNGGDERHGGANGNLWKWGAGAALAALLLGGGYLVLNNRDSAPTETEVAYNEEPAPNAFTSDTSKSGGATAETANAGASSSSPSQTTGATRSSASRAPAEETIGVAPASASARNNDELTVTAKRLVWTRKPSARRLATYYPERALERGREGEARLRCRVENDGALDCVRASNAPDRDGFGRAALRVSRTLRHAPRLADGSRAYGSSIRLRVVFRMPDEDRRRG